MVNNRSDIPAFYFQHVPSCREEDFFVSSANRRAREAIGRDSQWPAGRLVLVGPPRSGKTHLLKIWIAAAGARELVADDLNAGTLGEIGGTSRIAIDSADALIVDKACEEAMLHLCNMLSDGGGKLLLTSRTAPSRWNLELPDLRSRLEGSHMMRIEEPDDTLLSALLTKLFADRQMSVAPRVINFIVPRILRSYTAAHDVVDALDEISLVERGRINFQMAAKALQPAATDGRAEK